MILVNIRLIDASRFDVAWNPAVDAQTMARIHRDSQKRPCVIYRFSSRTTLAMNRGSWNGGGERSCRLLPIHRLCPDEP